MAEGDLEKCLKERKMSVCDDAGDDKNTVVDPITEKVEFEMKSNNVQWLLNGKRLIPIGRTVSNIPSGVYKPVWDSNNQKGVPESLNYTSDKLFTLPVKIIDKVLKDIGTFWEKESHYNKFKSVYKRGILLYGMQGCGKSSIILLLVKELLEKYNGLVFFISNHEELTYFISTILPDIKDIEPNRKIIVVLEDIDTFLTDYSIEVTKLLNFLDGAISTSGIVTIATTNYPEKLQERIVNRPSRFDRRYEVGKPDEDVRRYFLLNKLAVGDLTISDDEMNKIVKDTEGFTIDHLKEYFTSVYVLDYTHDEAISEISEISNTKILKNTDGKSKIGFCNEQSKIK